MPQDDGIHVVGPDQKRYVFPQGTGHDDIVKYFLRNPETATRLTSPPGAPKPPEMKESLAPKIVRASARSLPAIGAGVGAVLGGTGGTFGAGPIGTAAGGVVGAGLGGGIGRSGQGAIESFSFGEGPRTTKEVAKTVGRESAEQAEMEMGGQVLSRGGKLLAESPVVRRWVARPLNRMLRPGVDAFDYVNPGAELAKQKSLPTLTGKYGMKGYIEGQIETLSRTRDGLASQMARNGVTVDVEAPIKQTIAEHIKGPSEYENKAVAHALEDIEERFTTQAHPGGGMVAGPKGKLTPLRVSRGGQAMPLDRAIEFRQYIDTEIKGFDPESTSPVKRALQELRGKVNEAIHSTSPNLKELDTQLGGLIESRKAMGRRIAHLESGTRETTAGQGAMGKIADKLHIPGTRTVPGATGIAKSRRALTQLGGTPTKQEILHNLPRGVSTGKRESENEDENDPAHLYEPMPQ